MASQPLTVREILAILPETPRLIATLTAGLKPTQLHASPTPDAWSISDVLAHLRACHDVLGGSILRILAEDAPSWRRMSPRTWIKKTDYLEWEFAPALDAFDKQRAELLAVVGPLSPAAWERTATVTEPVGKIFKRSARFYGDWMAGHERVHWQQIRTLVDASCGRARVELRLPPSAAPPRGTVEAGGDG